MPNRQDQLPQEILEQVFQHVPHNDLLTCLYVCHAWFASAKHLFYKELQFSRLSSLDRFINCMEFSPDQSNLLVQKITFTFSVDRTRGYMSNFDHQFRQLVTLCPHVETLASTRQLEDHVVKALYRLPLPLKNLCAFPYSLEPEYNVCALVYSPSLKEYIMCNSGDKVFKIGFGGLNSFPNLRKLSLMEAPLRTLQDVERVLSMCPQLEALSVELDDDADEEDYADLLPLSLPQQQHPKLKSLTIHCPQEDIDTKVYYPFLLKCNNLERLKLVANNIKMPENPPFELEAFINLINALPSVTFMFEGDDSNRTCEVALQYLQSLFHSRSKYTTTFLNIESDCYTHRGGDYYLHYTANRNKRRDLDIVLPAFETSDTNLHSTYVKTFAPHVNRLSLDYELTDVYINASESFLCTVLSQCIALDSLTILHGTFKEALSPIANNTLRTLFLASCHITSTFTESVSSNCVNLCQLTLRNIEYANGNPIIMSQTELQLLELNMSQFITSTQVLIRIRDSRWEWFFYTNFEENLYMVPGKRWTPKECPVVLLEFKSIRQLRVCNLDGHKDMTLELV